MTTIHRELFRFLEGVSTQSSSSVFADVTVPITTDWAITFQDFTNGWDVGTGGEYTHTNTNGTLGVEGPTGVLTQTLGGADDDLSQFQQTLAPYYLATGKKFVFECRAKIGIGSGGSLGKEEIVIGLTSVQTGTNFMAANGLSRAFDDGIAFVALDGNANWSLLQGENDTFSSEIYSGSYANDTWCKFKIYYDGSSTKFYIDDTLVATLIANLPTSIISPVLYIKAGEAVAKTLKTDYYLIAVER